MSKDNGGPAFPMVVTRWNQDEEIREVTSDGGMTLRDYFAARAMQGFCANPDRDLLKKDSIDFAVWAYMQADTMLAERAK